MTDRNWQAWKNFGAALYEGGRTQEALQAFLEEARIDPGDPDAWVNLGMTYGALERHSESASAFERAVRLDPSDKESLHNLTVERALARQR